ncbi:MAG TPA: HypC/HybG/HupF family hydrogenase formation chaperone [bacterium]|nr:HypC/HybG/HupF family hydrogenase formation chaperone [bacterium]
MCLAIPGQIVEITEDEPVRRSGRVRFGGAIREVHLGYVPEARVGDYVNVHAGFALAVIDAKEARESLRLWNQIAEKESERRSP